MSPVLSHLIILPLGGIPPGDRTAVRKQKACRCELVQHPVLQCWTPEKAGLRTMNLMFTFSLT